jgi:ribA/ribD-fused uncharacterized protein
MAELSDDDEPFFLEESDGEGHDAHPVFSNEGKCADTPLFFEESDGEERKFLFFCGMNGHNGFLGNFYRCSFSENGKEFKTVEQYKHYKKAELFGDDKAAELILHAKNAMTAKRIGCNKINKFVKTTWDAKKVGIVMQGLVLKFLDPVLRKKLLDTGTREIVEASPYNRFWGIGFGANGALKKKHLWGKNMLGQCLMDVRANAMYIEEKLEEYSNLMRQCDKQ